MIAFDLTVASISDTRLEKPALQVALSILQHILQAGSGIACAFEGLENFAEEELGEATRRTFFSEAKLLVAEKPSSC